MPPPSSPDATVLPDLVPPDLVPPVARTPAPSPEHRRGFPGPKAAAGVAACLRVRAEPAASCSLPWKHYVLLDCERAVPVIIICWSIFNISPTDPRKRDLEKELVQ